MYCKCPIVNTVCCAVSDNDGLCNLPSNGGADSFVCAVRVFLGMAGNRPVPVVCQLQLEWSVVCPESPADPSGAWCLCSK